MHLVEYHPTNFSHNFRSSVQHRSQNFRGHNQTRCCGIDRNITGHQANVTEILLKLSVFLIAERLDRACVDDPLIVFQTLCNSVFCDHRLSGAGMGRN